MSEEVYESAAENKFTYLKIPANESLAYEELAVAVGGAVGDALPFILKEAFADGRIDATRLREQAAAQLGDQGSKISGDSLQNAVAQGYIAHYVMESTKTDLRAMCMLERMRASLAPWCVREKSLFS